VSRDFVSGLDFGTQQKNRFIYVTNSPLLSTDPSGLDALFEKIRLGLFGGFGGSMEVGIYTDTNTGNSSLIITPGVGAGYGGGVTVESGMTFSDLPTSGPELKANLGVGTVITDFGVSATLDPISNLSSLQAKAGTGFLSARAGINSELQPTLGVSPGTSFGAEASGTFNWRFAFAFKHGALGDWLFNRFMGNEQYRMTSEILNEKNQFQIWFGTPPGQGK
jgi:hypothetical protein